MFLVGRKYFGQTKSQQTHFDSLWSQHTFFGSRKVATYLFWVAQSRANVSVALSGNIPIFSLHGRNIPFFGSYKVATCLVWVEQSRIKFSSVGQSRNGRNIPDLGRIGRNIPILIRKGRNTTRVG